MAAENFKVKKGLEVGTGATITSGGINVTGIITATQLVGDGSGLTNVVGSGSGIVVKDEGSAVGTAGTINFAGTGVVAALSAGIATVTISSGGLDNVVGDTTPELGGNLNLNSKFITGSGGINVTGVVTATTLKGNGDFVDIDVDGQTELDELNVAGITTFNANVDVKAELTANKLILDDDGSSSPTLTIAGDDENVFGMVLVNDTYKSSAAAGFKHTQLNSGEIQVLLRANNSATRLPYKIQQGNAPSGLWDSFTIDADGAVKLGFGGTQKLETTGTGIAVPNISVSGVGTFSTRIDTNGVSFGTNSTTFAAKFADNARAIFGGATQGDFGIYHDTNHSYLHRIPGGQGDIYMMLGGDNAIIAKTDNSVELYWDDAKKLETDNAGVKITGVATATSFSGSAAGLTNIPSAQLSGALPALDGSALTGVTASGSGVVVKHDGSTVGTAGTINFSTNLDVSAISAGIVTITASGGSATNTISQGNSSVEVIGSGTDDGEFKILLQDNTATGAGRTAFRMYQPAANSTSAEFFKENTALYSLLELNAVYSGNTAQTIRFGTNNANFNGRIRHMTGTGRFDFYSKYNGTDYNPLRISNSIITTNATIYPLANNTYDLGYQGTGGGAQTLWWRQLYVHNIRAGIVTATTFSGALAASNLTGALPAISGANLTTLNADELDSGTIPNGRFPATLPASSGANLTSLNADNISSGTLASARIEDEAITFAKMQHVGTGVFIGRDSSGTGDIETLTAAEARTLLNVSDGATAGITTSSSNVVATWDVVNSSASAYVFTGPGQSSSSNPDIYLVRGLKYRFAVNASGHPFFIKTSSTTGTSNQYTNGVTGNGTQVGNVEFYVPNDAPARLYYICQYHPGMVGNLYILGGIQTGITSTRFTGQVDVTNVLNVTSDLNITNGIIRRDNKLWLQALSGNPTYYSGTPSGSAGDHIFKTHSGGFNYEQCRINLSGVNITGVCTATHFYGNGANLTNLNGSAITTGTVAANRVATLNQSTTGNAATATAFSVTSNNTTNETVYPVFVDGNSGTQGAEVDTALTYNPSSNTLTTGTIDLGDANISSGTATISSTGNVDTTAAGSCSAIEYTIYASHSSGIQSQKVLIMDNGSTAYSNEFAVMFSSSLLISFSADLVGAAVRLRGTPESGISGNISIKFIKTIIE